MNSADFANKLSWLASVCVKVGLNLRRGQELIITAPLEARPLVRSVTRAAYRRGARLVTCFYDDPEMMRDRFLYAEDHTLDYAPAWIYHRMKEALDNDAARLWVAAPYPDLLAGIQVEKTLRVHKALAQASEFESAYIASSRINWSMVPCVTASWARQVFPEAPTEEAMQILWEKVFDFTRVNSSDPIRAWEEHDEALNARRQFLQDGNFEALHFYDGRTDLMVGLAEGHRWTGGPTRSANGIEFHCSIPMEEIFTCPHRDRVEGHVFLSRPLAVAGTVVKDLRVEFRDGLAIAVEAEEGQGVFQALLSGDEGARRLGEIGLVPNSSPVSRSGLLFYNALLDENAASHMAFGQFSASCLSTTPEKAGANRSLIHVDCMFGNGRMNVDGVGANGQTEPVMREGEFCLDDCR